MYSELRRSFKKNCREKIYDNRGNFLGETEYVGNGLYNHYDQDGIFLESTDSSVFDFEKYVYEKVEEENEE